ncbi:MAG TPA: TonB-dependent receptor [Puia sp.]|nr:TonB-dependent receptor [Puia sp.]
MRNHLRKTAVALCALIFSTSFLFAQTITITGQVHEAGTKTAVPSASVIIKGAGIGTYTDGHGNFKLSTTQKPPFTLIVSSIGYETQEVQVTDASVPVTVEFKTGSSLGTEVVVSASRVPERILESPVTIERINASQLTNIPAPSYYDAIRNLKGVDVTNSSLIFASYTTRGFNASGNPRFNQFMDGMDNQAPGLNFSVGSIVGVTNLDVDNMEMLPGASSALYGSGGMNGTLLISSKDPFKYQGVSAEVKGGIMHLGKNDPISSSPYQDYSLRWGVKVSDKFAFKIAGQFIQAKDWVANDTTDYTGVGAGSGSHVIPGTRTTDPNYNGVNVYGDETSANMLGVSNQVLGFATEQYVAAYEAQSGGIPPSQAQINTFLATNPNTAPFYLGQQAGIIPNQNVSRTGYQEYQVIDNTVKSIKVNAGLYFKLNDKTEASLTGNYGTGNTVYTGSDRYSLKDFKMGQYKLEIKSDKWFFKAYTTQENSGQAYNATVTTQLFNEAWKSSTLWYPEFVGAYVQAISGGASQTQAYNAARAYADQGRPAPGSAQFNQIFDSVRSMPIPKGGLFLDRTSLYHLEGQYNLTDVVKFAEVIVGASWRMYRLNSEGTLFADSTGPINTNEYGAYVQISKRFLDDKLKLTASGRYDKNQNFDGKFTPRVSAVFTVAKDQNIRASYQNAYRFPTNQNQWINLNTGAGILIGGLPQLRTFYNFENNPVYNATTFQPQNFGTYKPESVNAYELGYKGLFNKTILVDAYGYYSDYMNFIGRVSVVQAKTMGTPINPNDPSTYQGYSVSVNSTNKVSTYGFGISVDYLLPNNFELSGSVSSDNIHNPDSTFVTYWNTPQYRFTLSLLNKGFGPKKKFGFNIIYRWQDSYYTQSDFKQGNVSAYGTFDASVSYKLLPIRSMIKIGATNLTNKYYVSQFGNPAIGGLYYASFGFNVF